MRGFRLIFTRYTVGSVLAAVLSEATLLLTYGPGLLGPGAASVVAWGAGAALNYVLNRWWAWGRRGRASLWRELVPYWVIAVASMVLSAWATGAADRFAPRLVESDALRTAFVGGAFLAVYGVMFVVKFVLFHYFVFAGAPTTRSAEAGAETTGSARRSRHQVPITTRE
ncbi:GtrA family protein [Actinomadura spongiicola]|uniref:GtrA family protein n=1 Tax=Actinomadura spongiicola TaxID=2303421 RepID=A0A372GDI0_9ACTN|nr:GtrA family protein [Actinomadura spongiicola]RFS83441.1 GtrA family protein [Actinomadura spongiicola]